jgi:hypothetical protein
VHAFLSLILAASLATAAVAEPVTFKTPVAVVADEPVTLGDVLLGNAGALQRLGGSETDRATIVRGAQVILDELLTNRLLDEAAELEKIVVKEEAVRAAAPTAFDPTRLQNQLDRITAVPRAVLLVRRGEDKVKVWETHLARHKAHGVTMEAFEIYLNKFPSTDAIETYLRHETTETLKKRLIAAARQRVIREQLKPMLQARAKTSGKPYDDVRDAFWTGLLTATRARVLDARFRLPNLKGLP